MEIDYLHIYSDTKNRGGANIAADSLFNCINKQKVIKFLSKSYF